MTAFYRKLRITLASLILLSSNILTAQPGGGGMGPRGGGGGMGPGGNGAPERMKEMAMIGGNVYLTSEDGSDEVPGVGVIVTVFGKKVNSKKVDTLYTTVGEGGRFMIGGLAKGDVFIKFSMLGYEEQSNAMKLTAGMNKVLVNLKEERLQLDAAIKKETVSPISVKSDTIIFHASAVKVNKGENALEVLEQMPGVEVSTSSVTVLGETVKNVYIDGALLFGNAPMQALNNLPAEEVVTIKSFQEYSNKDPNHKISKNETKDRVLDISTKSKSKGFVMVNAVAGGGFDTDTTYHKFRYTAGVSAAYFSEALMASIDFNANNINDNTIRGRGNFFRNASGGGSADLKSITLNVNVNKNWMSPTTRNFKLGSIGGSYSYSNKEDINEQLGESIYFPTSEYTSRKTETSSYSSTGSKVHTFSLNGMKSLTDGEINANVSYSIDDGTLDSRSRNYNYQDDLSPQGTSSSTSQTSDAHNFSAVLSARKGFNDKIRIGASASYSENNSDAGSVKIDTTTSTITTKILDMSTGAVSRNFNIAPSLSFELSDRTSLGANYSYNNSYSQTQQWAYDVAGQIDTVNTYLRTNDNNTHQASLFLNTAFGKDDNIILKANLSFNSVGLNRSDAFPDDEPYYFRRFNSLMPSLSIGNDSQINRWDFRISSSGTTPSIEQLRPKINNTNLYNVSAGNPDLKQSNHYNFSLSYSSVLGKDAEKAIEEKSNGFPMMGGRDVERFLSGDFITLRMNANFTISDNVIVSKKTYYSEETYLPDYSYTMPAQSTFSTYENASAAYSASFNANAGFPLKTIMCILNTGASVSWDKSPSYVNSVLTQTQNLRPTLSLGIRSNFSKDIRINLNGNASYIHSDNDAGDAKDYFTEAVRAGFELNNILKIIYLGGNYTKTFTQGITYTSINDNILDLNAGVRFGPRNNYDFCLKVHDIFNKTSGYSTAMHDDYVSNSWKHNFGRYVMLTFTYHFTTMKGGEGRGMGRGMGMGMPPR